MEEDFRLLSAEYKWKWAILVDKGFQRVQKSLQGVHPNRKPASGILSLLEERFNEKISGYRVIVENRFGRMEQMCTVINRKFKWAESNYDMIMKLCMVLCKYQIGSSPFPEE